MGYYSLKVPIHNNDVINNSSPGLITCNESMNQQFCFIFHVFWTNERGERAQESKRKINIWRLLLGRILGGLFSTFSRDSIRQIK